MMQGGCNSSTGHTAVNAGSAFVWYVCTWFWFGWWFGVCIKKFIFYNNSM